METFEQLYDVVSTVEEEGESQTMIHSGIRKQFLPRPIKQEREVKLEGPRGIQVAKQELPADIVSASVPKRESDIHPEGRSDALVVPKESVPFMILNNFEVIEPPFSLENQVTKDELHAFIDRAITQALASSVVGVCTYSSGSYSVTLQGAVSGDAIMYAQNFPLIGVTYADSVLNYIPEEILTIGFTYSTELGNVINNTSWKLKTSSRAVKAELMLLPYQIVNGRPRLTQVMIGGLQVSGGGTARRNFTVTVSGTNATTRSVVVHLYGVDSLPISAIRKLYGG